MLVFHGLDPGVCPHWWPKL